MTDNAQEQSDVQHEINRLYTRLIALMSKEVRDQWNKGVGDYIKAMPTDPQENKND